MFPMRAKQKGFTLIELLIVIAIIGLIAAMLIPNLLDAMQKAKQKRTIADMRIVGTAMFSWITDQVGAAAAGAASTANVDMASYGSAKEASDLQTVLVPQYLQYVPVLDGWKSRYEYYLNTEQLLAKHGVEDDKHDEHREQGEQQEVAGLAEQTTVQLQPGTAQRAFDREASASLERCGRGPAVPPLVRRGR